MNNSYQAKSGFKTFIFVFLISLGIFSAFYYLTSSPNEEIDIENYSAPREDVLGEATQKTAFEDLAKQKPPAVLAGADIRDVPETTQSTTPVPDTGSAGITWAFLVSMSVLAWGMYTAWLGPRNLALSNFEKKITKE